jgi:polar amino acid transport system substrate-binding protein
MSVAILLRLSRRTWAALAIIVGYALLAASAELGATIAGAGLDPVWAGARARGTLRVAVDYGFYPFTDIQNDEPRGYDIDLARAVAAKLGLRAEFVGSGLDSMYDDLVAGKADMAASALPYAPEQSWRVRFSEFYFNAGQVLVTPELSPISAEADLRGRRVAVALGSDADAYARALRARVPGIVVQPLYDTPADALLALRRGAADAAIVDNTSALVDFRDPGLHIAAALTLEPYVLVVAAPAFQLQGEVNRALDELRREGFFEALGERWFVDAPRTLR